jgi:hypothetical protein
MEVEAMKLPLLLCVVAVLVVAHAARADEGMWTFDNPPLKALKEKYGFTPTPEWLEHVRLSSVRFNDGGSGSFVSQNGLVMTNHHVAAGQLQKMSTPQKDHLKDGFHARTPAEEKSCPDLELNVLVSIEDVTSRVKAAVKTGASEKDAHEQRKAEMARIEKESLEATGLRSDVITLYGGGQYHLYRAKKYTDVRLVFAPESQIAFFGGDPDNFTYPRYDLDCAFFRVYENGEPVRTSHWLKWSENGASEGEPVFVSGHPGSTSRQLTLAQLEFLRDHEYPLSLASLNRRRKLLEEFSAKSAEHARRAKSQLFSIENSIKVRFGELEGLQGPNLLAKKAAEEKAFREQVLSDAEARKEFGGAWDAVAQAAKHRATFLGRHAYSTFRGTRFLQIAGHIVRLAAEVRKPNEKRLPEYRDSALESLKFNLFSPAPIYKDLETTTFADAIAEARDVLGADDPYVKALLGGRTPEEVAEEAVSGTKLDDPSARKALVEGGEQAVSASTDPMIAISRRIDPIARELRKKYEDEVESVITENAGKIARARFRVYGATVYPDATFTLRLAYGKVAGYPAGGTLVPYKTTFFGLYERSASFENRPPFDLPPRYVERRASLDLATPLNFVCTTDITGGNSGSPVFNRQAEIVGLIFDGNIQSFPNKFIYSEEQARAVAVHSRGIIEALRAVYDTKELADELQGNGEDGR